MTFVDAMRQATEELGDDPEEINAGECLDWAELVCSLYPQAKLDTIQYMEDYGHHDCYHAYVVYDGRFYDAETPLGVEHAMDLTFIVRSIGNVIH